MSAMNDILTVLRSPHCTLAKTWHVDNSITNYSKAKYFQLEEVSVKNINDLSELLIWLESDKNACVIRGRFIGEEKAKKKTPDTEYKSGSVLRRDVIFDDLPLHTILIEVDDYKPMFWDPIKDSASCIEEYINFRLPKEFQNISYHWQLSNSAGHPTKQGILKAHLWFWSATPRTSAQLKEWAHFIKLRADHSVFNKIQIHYTSAPIFEKGVIDPISMRSGFYKGNTDMVNLNIEANIFAGTKKHNQIVKSKSDKTKEKDEIAEWLWKHWAVYGESSDGTKLHIRCPWEKEHTVESDTSSTVYFLAGTGGYKKGHFKCMHSHCSERTDKDFLTNIGYMSGYFENLELSTNKKQLWEEPVDVSSFLRSPPDPIEWFISDRIQKGRGILLTGAGGSSKTRAMYHLAIGAAIGKLPWEWNICTKGRSLLVLTEDTQSDVHRTLYGLCQAMGLGKEECKTVSNSVIPYALAGTECQLLSFNKDHVLEESELFRALEEKIKSLSDVVFVGLDPALSLSPGDELDQSHQRTLGKMADDLAVRTGAAVMLVSHASKASLNREELDSHNSRGGGAITDAVRGEFSMRTMTQQEARKFGIDDMEERKCHVQLVATKGNYLPPSAYVPVWLRRVEYGALCTTDLNLEEIYRNKLKAVDLEIFEVLKELPKNSDLNSWRKECIDQGLIKAGKYETQMKRMRRSVDRLKKSGYISNPTRGVYIPSIQEERVEEFL